MANFEFVCLEHSDTIISITAQRRRHIEDSRLRCSLCGATMEQYYGNVEPTVSLGGHNWPKRDIKESARRKRRSRELGERQKKVWKDRMPTLNLDPEVQREYKEKVSKDGAPLTVKKV